MLPPVVRVFISSTFLDLQEERNILHMKVFPRIKQLCEDKGLSFLPVELRWGITDEEKKQGRVLSLCLSEIDECDFFIGIVGDRYGTVMSEISEEAINKHTWLKDFVGCSLTEIEMFYGALGPNCDSSCASFYIKSSASIADDKVVELRHKIKSSDKILSKEYLTIDEFSENVYADLTHFVNSQYSKNDVTNKEEWYNSELRRYYVANEHFHRFLDNYYISEQIPLLLFGDNLVGKTAVLSNWALSKKSHSIIINCNAEDKARYWPNISIRIMRELTKRFDNVRYPDFNIPESMQLWIESRDETIDTGNFSEGVFYNYLVTDEEVEQFRKSFVDWFINISISDDVIIVLNDLQLVRKWGETAFLGWLPNLAPDKIHVFASVNDSFTIDILERKGWGSVEFKGISQDEAKEFIFKYLNHYGKRLSDNNIQSFSKASYFRLPGMIKFASDYLISIANNENLETNISNISTLNTGAELFGYVITNVYNDFEDEKKDIFKNLLSLLSISRFSLDEYEVLEILNTIYPVHSIEWEDVKLRCFPFLGVSSGKMQIVANVVNEYIINTFLTEEKSILLHTIMGDFYCSKFGSYLANDDLPEISMVEQMRICTDSAVEVLYHYRVAKNWDKLYSAVTDFPMLFFLAKVNWDMVLTSWIELITNTDYSLLTAYKGITLRCIELLSKEDWHEDYFRLYRKIVNMCDKFKFEEIARELDCASLLFDQPDKGISPDTLYKILPKIRDSFLHDPTDENMKREYKKYQWLLSQTDQFEKNNQELASLEFIENNLSKFSGAFKCRVLYQCINLCHNMGFGKKAELYTNELFDLSIKISDNFLFMLALGEKARLEYNSGNHEEALVLYEKYKNACCLIGNIFSYYSTLNDIARIFMHDGKYDEAKDYYEIAIKGFYKTGAIPDALATKNNLAISFMKQNDMDSAFNLLKEVYDESKNRNDCIQNYISALNNMGYISITQHKPNAEKYLIEAYDIAKKIGHIGSMCGASAALVQFYRDTSMPSKGVLHLQDLQDFLVKYEMIDDLLRVIEDELELLSLAKHKSKYEERLLYWDRTLYKITNGQITFSQYMKQKEEFWRSENTLNTTEFEKLTFNEKLYYEADDFDRLIDTLETQFEMLLNKKADISATISVVDRIIRYSYEKGRIDLAQDKTILKAMLLLEIQLFETVKYPEGLAFLDDSLIGQISNSNLKTFITNWHNFNTTILIGEMDIAATICESILGNFITNEFDTKYVYRFITHISDVIAKKQWGLLLKNVITALSKIDSLGETEKKYIQKSLLNPSVEKALSLVHSHTQNISYYFKEEAALNIIDFCETVTQISIETKNLNLDTLAGNMALLFRRLKNEEKTYFYHQKSIDSYKEKDRVNDVIIEMMNLSTAYWEFGNLSKAIETLRDAKILAKNEKLYALLASICGNLAKYLVFDDADNLEIYELFSLEENYFKESKEYRGVVVSLLNQYAFYDKVGNDELSLSKLKEAVEIIKSHKFPEFKEILAHYNQISSKKGLDEKIFITVCKKINKWLNQLHSETKCKIVENTNERCVMYQVEEREKYIFVNEFVLQISATDVNVIMQITANLIITRDNIWKGLKNYLDWLISITMDFIQYDEKSNKIIFQFEFDLTKAKGGLLSDIPALIKTMEYKWRAEETALTLVVTGDYGMDEIKQMRTMLTSSDCD